MNLNPYQQAAVDADARRILVKAGAGSRPDSHLLGLLRSGVRILQEEVESIEAQEARWGTSQDTFWRRRRAYLDLDRARHALETALGIRG